MATAQRVFYETVAVLVFLVLLVATWFLSGYRAERRLDEARATHQRESAQLVAEQRTAVDRLAKERREAAAAADRREAEAVFRAYAAGIQPAVKARWRRYLGSAAAELQRGEPRIAFVHLAAPGGGILYSSDDEISARGSLADDADWVLAAATPTIRDGAAGLLEVAGPVFADDRPIAHLWLGYAAPAGLDPAGQ